MASMFRREHCPTCGKPGSVLYQRVADLVGGVPGEWSYRWCPCETMWLDPAPDPHEVERLYPEGYWIRTPPGDPLRGHRGPLGAVRRRVKLGILRAAFGYRGEGQGAAWERWVAKVPPLVRWAGYTVRFVPDGPGRVLDAGCGNGGYLVTLARLGSRSELMGLEPDPDSARFCEEAGIRVEREPVERATLEASSVRAITLNHVLEHLVDPRAALHRMVGWLEPGGLFVSISPNPVSFLARAFGPHWRGLEPPRHLVLLGPRALRALAEEAGLAPRIWTTARHFPWVARESLALRRSASADAPVPALLRHPVAVAARAAALPNRARGEEVVLVARKGG